MTNINGLYEVGDVLVNGTDETIGADSPDPWLPGEKRVVTETIRKNIGTDTTLSVAVVPLHRTQP